MLEFSRSDEVAAEVCRLIASGLSLRQIGKHFGVTHAAITMWRLDDPEFAFRYARAREIQIELMADEILEIADESGGDWQDTENGRILDPEHVQRSRLRVDSRKWLLSKIAPKKYGDRVDSEITVRRAPFEMTDEELAAIAAKGVPVLPPPIEEE